MNKSAYDKGRRCHKMLWLNQHNKELSVGVDEGKIATGLKVKEVGRQYFGDYCLVDISNSEQDVFQQTKEYMSSGEENIAEASFLYNGFYCTVDVLHKNGDGWDIVEVISSTYNDTGKVDKKKEKKRDNYLENMAFQYYILDKCAVKINKVYLLCINKKYVYKEQLNIKELFVADDVTREVINKVQEVENNVSTMQLVLNANTEPKQEIGCHCEEPYECEYQPYCQRNLPENSIFKLSGVLIKKKYELYSKGIISYEDIVKNISLITGDATREKVRQQVESIYYQKDAEYNAGEIKKFLEELRYPIYYLDFETIQPAIPEFDGCTPYEQIPFQYSLHIEYEDGSLEHLEFLAKEGSDPRKAFAESLVNDIPKDACIVVYNQTFEIGVIKELAKDFPDMAEHLMSFTDNIKDLMKIFKNRFYYSKDMHGSASLKAVLPALFPNDSELNYENLEDIHNGMDASTAFANLSNCTAEEVESIRESLKKYCELDTYAMVKICKKLKEVVYR